MLQGKIPDSFQDATVNIETFSCAKFQQNRKDFYLPVLTAFSSDCFDIPLEHSQSWSKAWFITITFFQHCDLGNVPSLVAFPIHFMVVNNTPNYVFISHWVPLLLNWALILYITNNNNKKSYFSCANTSGADLGKWKVSSCCCCCFSEAAACINSIVSSYNVKSSSF